MVEEKLREEINRVAKVIVEKENLNKVDFYVFTFGPGVVSPPRYRVYREKAFNNLSRLCYNKVLPGEAYKLPSTLDIFRNKLNKKLSLTILCEKIASNNYEVYTFKKLFHVEIGVRMSGIIREDTQSNRTKYFGYELFFEDFRSTLLPIPMNKSGVDFIKLQQRFLLVFAKIAESCDLELKARSKTGLEVMILADINAIFVGKLIKREKISQTLLKEFPVRMNWNKRPGDEVASSIYAGIEDFKVVYSGLPEQVEDKFHFIIYSLREDRILGDYQGYVVHRRNLITPKEIICLGWK